jgi:hypothetical protein
VNPRELAELVLSQKALGLSTLVLTMPAPKRWHNRLERPDRVSTPFGRCRWSHSTQDGRIVFYVEVAKVEAWLERAIMEQCRSQGPSQSP